MGGADIFIGVGTGEHTVAYRRQPLQGIVGQLERIAAARCGNTHQAAVLLAVSEGFFLAGSSHLPALRPYPVAVIVFPVNLQQNLDSLAYLAVDDTSRSSLLYSKDTESPFP